MASCPQLTVAIEQIPPGGLCLEGTVSFRDLEIADDDQMGCPQPLAFALQVTRVHLDILVRGHLKTVLQCRCDRCLCRYDHALETDDVCHLFEKPVEKVLDLTEGVREDILLSFPLSCLCGEDCRGLCPTCGKDLNEVECSCPSREPDNDLWHVLEGLDIDPTSPD